MRTIIGLAMGLLLVSAIGCSDGAGSGGTAGGASSSSGDHGAGGSGGGDPGPTPDAACTDAAKSSCERDQSCTNGFVVSLVFGDMDTCVAVKKASCLAALEAPDTGSTPATKEACAEDTPKESCVDFFDLSAAGACDTPVGAREDGEPCGAAAQCKSTFCAVPSGAVCGTCAALPNVGAACSTLLDCAPGQICNTNTSTCQLPVKEGGACSYDAVCDTFLGCDDGGTGSGNGTCKALPAKVGAACDPNVGCDVLRGFLCWPSSNTCGVISLAKPGETCGLVGDTSYALCASDAICDMAGGQTGTCVVPVGEGEACDTHFGPSCETGLTCVGEDGTGKCQKFDPAACH
ncbi:MAG TPA: hypothetical protein VHB21_20600 [Minicystis sp.]|nr:hypothetical protein [Minicystis sp.]